jgi:hypothetical protein
MTEKSAIRPPIVINLKDRVAVNAVCMLFLTEPADAGHTVRKALAKQDFVKDGWGLPMTTRLMSLA